MLILVIPFLFMIVLIYLLGNLDHLGKFRIPSFEDFRGGYWLVQLDLFNESLEKTKNEFLAIENAFKPDKEDDLRMRKLKKAHASRSKIDRVKYIEHKLWELVGLISNHAVNRETIDKEFKKPNFVAWIFVARKRRMLDRKSQFLLDYGHQLHDIAKSDPDIRGTLTGIETGIL